MYTYINRYIYLHIHIWPRVSFSAYVNIFGTPSEPTFYDKLFQTAILQIFEKCVFDFYRGGCPPKCPCRTLTFSIPPEYSRI